MDGNGNKLIIKCTLFPQNLAALAHFKKKIQGEQVSNL